jgi:hypothetical protein
LPLTTWFWAAHVMATHSNGMSARQLEDQFSGADAGWRTRKNMAKSLRCAPSAVAEALDRMGPEVAKRRVGALDDEYLIGEPASSPIGAASASAAYQRAEASSLKAENASLRKDVERLEAELKTARTKYKKIGELPPS